MAYKRITIMDISETIRRRRNGQNITQISRALGLDRKTVRKHITEVDANRINTNNYERPGRPAKKQALLESYLDEIRCLVNNKANPLKPKTAFEVICVRHNLFGKVSYTSCQSPILSRDSGWRGELSDSVRFMATAVLRRLARLPVKSIEARRAHFFRAM